MTCELQPPMFFYVNIMSTTQVYIMLGQKIKYHLGFRKMTSVQHYIWSTIKLVLHVCISIFPNNWEFMKLCKLPLSNISFCNSYGFQCFHFCNIYTYTIMNMWFVDGVHEVGNFEILTWKTRNSDQT